MKFRYDINALRALAVIVVILFHFKIKNFAGGFAGVDIFFVISGYLMSKIILNSFDKSNFSLIEFYKKRFVRIFPALLVLIIFIQLIASFVLLPIEQKQLSTYALSSQTFISNIFYYLKSGYFEASSESNLLLHTWSLSVEWQFYMIYPILLLPLKKIYINKRNIFNLIIMLSFIISLLFSIYLAKNHANFSFYNFPTRSWEMLIGCVIVLYESKFENSIPLRIRNLITIISLFILILFLTTFDSHNIWPNYYTLIPTISTSLIILSKSNFKFTEINIIQFIGKISYSLYLWHWPLYVYMINFNLENNYSIIALSFIVVILSILSYKYVETNKILFSTLQKRLLYTSFAIITSSLMYFINFNDLIISDEIINLSNYKNNHLEERAKQFSLNKCFIYSESEYKDFSKQQCLVISKSKKNVLLIGDSHAAQFSQSLNEKLTSLNINLLQTTTSQCLPLLNTTGRTENVKLINYVLKEFIPSNSSKIDLIILSANWVNDSYIKKNNIEVKILELINYIKKYNIKIKIIGQTENYTIPFPIISARKMMYQNFVDYNNYIDKKSYNVNELLKSTISKDIYLDIFNIENNKVSSNFIPYMSDKNHLTKLFTDRYIEILINKGLLD